MGRVETKSPMKETKKKRDDSRWKLSGLMTPAEGFLFFVSWTGTE